MPTRYLKPGIRDSERIEAVSSADAEILYYRLLITVDDFGRSDARPMMVKSACFPIRLRATADKCMQWMQELEQSGLLFMYQVDGKPYLQITKWDNKARSQVSKYPDPPVTVCNPRAVADIPFTSLPGTGTGTGTGTSANADVSKPTVSPCPHLEIIALYAKHLPQGRQVNGELWSGTRAKHLQARWRENPKRQSLEFWDKFFKFCAESDFLAGRVNPKPGQKPFQVSLDWIIEPGNFVKIYEGAYN